ncbi:MAG: SPOR domain-containing protein [Bacteroidales bacterium]|nr:SPOR domain-containing protein [Bacteroidales bacterium]
MIYGKILDYTGQKLSSATISIFNPKTFNIEETIPVDDLGEYLFTVEKGSYIGFLVEKDSYFPYYLELKIPLDAENELEKDLYLPDGIRKDYSLVYAPQAEMPSNTDLLEELISLLISQSGLSLWIPSQENPLGKSRLNFIDSLFQARGIEKYRLVSGSLPRNSDQIVQLNFLTDQDVSEPEQGIFENLATDQGEDNLWTLQFSASRNKLTARNLKGLKNTRMFKGKDGYYRYVYGTYSSRQEANQAISYLQSKGFSQAFPKKIGKLKKL